MRRGGVCNHTYKEEVVAPTCTEAGYTLHTCTECGDRYTDTETDALGHDYKPNVVAPTCTADGYTEQVCSRGDDSYKVEGSETDKLGHDYATTLSHDADGHYHECTRGDGHDTSVPHDYEGRAYGFSATGHYQTCECGQKSEEVAHKFDKEIKDGETLKHEADCLEPATYFKSCVCGWVSTEDTFTDGDALGHDLEHHTAVAGTETAKSSIEYWACKRDDCGKLYADADGKNEITESDIYSDKIGRLLTVSDSKQKEESLFAQNADGSISYTKTAGDGSAKLWFGEQNGHDCAAWEFDLSFDPGDSGTLSVVFRVWDDSNLYRLNVCSPDEDVMQIVKRRWVDSAAKTVNKTNINGFTLDGTAEYHVAVVCLGNDKIVTVDGDVVCRIRESELTVGYFGIESDGMDSIAIKNAVLRYYNGEDIAERRAAVEADYPNFWDELAEGVTNTCAHDYEDTVTPPTCKDDGYTTHVCKYCNDEYTDSTVPSTGAHVYSTYKIQDENHVGICSACGSESDPQAHEYTLETKNDNTLKEAETHEHGAIYFKSCVCGGVSADDNDTFTVDQVYKYRKDAVSVSENLKQADDGSLTYTRGDSDAAATITFGSQDGNPRQYVEFDLEFTAGDWGKFELQFRRCDGNSNMAIVKPTKTTSDDDGTTLTAIKTTWSDTVHGRYTTDTWDIAGFDFEDGKKYHVAIICCGWQKTVLVDGKAIFSKSFDGYNNGYFHLESWALQSLKISNIIIDESYADEAALAAAHPEVWYKPEDSGITVTERNS